MKIISYAHQGKARWGIVAGAGVVEVEASKVGVLANRIAADSVQA